MYKRQLFTLRNGNQKLPQYKKPYAEKLLISQEGQLCPMHFHWNKMEDIINRGGGTLVMQLYCSDEQEELDRNAAVEIVSDGVRMTLEPGALLELQPGQSVTLPQKVYHAFWAKRGTGPVLIGEVSQCNDDESDNRFWQAVDVYKRQLFTLINLVVDIINSLVDPRVSLE